MLSSHESTSAPLAPTRTVIGATDKQAGQPADRSYNAQNVLATLYHVLGIDPHTTLPDFSGRPLPLLDDVQPIAELV